MSATLRSLIAALAAMGENAPGGISKEPGQLTGPVTGPSKEPGPLQGPAGLSKVRFLPLYRPCGP